MNTLGFIRGMMVKNFDKERILNHVASTMEKQLKEWDPSYEMIVMKLANYEIIVRNEKLSFEISLTETEIDDLKKRDPYALDKRLWRELEENGLRLQWGYGNYLDHVFNIRK